MRDPQEITVIDGDGKSHNFILTKMTAWDGLEIMARLPSSIISGTVPKIGDWEIVKQLQLQIMKYVFIDINGQKIPLATQALIDNHCSDWECFAKLIKAEVTYNNSFFRNGSLSDFFAEAFQMSLMKIQEILTNSSQPSSQPEKQPSTN
ncbi:MAG: hypothetical protein KGL39_23580 [Patescibacteria group bacterium]|nr:hypothetical protein [Patescibacteria group bacterium]